MIAYILDEQLQCRSFLTNKAVMMAMILNLLLCLTDESGEGDSPVATPSFFVEVPDSLGKSGRPFSSTPGIQDAAGQGRPQNATAIRERVRNQGLDGTMSFKRRRWFLDKKIVCTEFLLNSAGREQRYHKGSMTKVESVRRTASSGQKTRAATHNLLK